VDHRWEGGGSGLGSSRKLLEKLKSTEQPSGEVVGTNRYVEKGAKHRWHHSGHIAGKPVEPRRGLTKKEKLESGVFEKRL